MDIDKMLRHVNNLNDYITVTQEVAKHEHNSSKVQFNMSTVLLMKKLRSLEIEVRLFSCVWFCLKRKNCF